MPLKIHFVEGARAGETLELGDDQDQIVIGRDGGKCDVVFPPEETKVGREHCALRRVLGRYRLVLNGRNLVLVGGKPAVDDQEVLNHSRVQLGPDGPVIQLESSLNASYMVTEAQEAIPTKASVIEELQQSARRGRNIALLTTTIIVAIVVAGVLLWRSLAEKDVALASQAARFEERIKELDDLTEDQQQAVRDVVAKYEQPDDDERLGAVLRNAEKAVFMVTVQNEQGGESGKGTAWVCDKEGGVLATNAHVAVIFNSLKEGERMIARNVEGKEVRVKGVRIHPGYRAFTDLWSEYAPGSRTGPASFELVKTPGSGGDVALLYLEETSDLPAALPLASRERLEKVDRLTPVGYVGFPMEGMSLVNSRTPTPVSHAAYVIATTNFYGSAAEGFEDRQLIHHALPVAGGASGSPILGSDGEVVAVLNAGTVIGISKTGTRITSGANINFAQRVDLVRELMDDSAAKAQAERTQRWKMAIAKHYKPGRALHRETRVQRVIDEWKRLLSVHGDFEVTTTEVAGETATPKSTGDGFELLQAFQSEPPHIGLAVGSTEESNRPIELSIRKAGAAVTGLPDRFGSVASTNWVKFQVLPFNNTDEYTAVVTAPLDDMPVSLQVFVAKRRRRTQEERMEYGLAVARKHFESLRKYRIATVSMVEAERSLSTQRDKLFSDSANVALAGKGDYFFAANSHGDEPIYLEVTQESGSPLSSVNQGNSAIAFAASPFSRSSSVVVTVIGKVKDQKYDLRVYKIAEKE